MSVPVTVVFSPASSAVPTPIPGGWGGTAPARFLTGPGLLVFLLTALAGYEGFLLQRRP